VSSFGTSTATSFGTSTTPAFGASSFGTLSTGSSFGTSTVSSFVGTTVPSFGTSTTPAFGASTGPIFGGSSFSGHTSASPGMYSLAQGTGISSVCALANDLKSLVNSENYSDVSFLVEGRIIHGHRSILAIRSARFKELFESGEKTIDINNIRHPVFLALIEYCLSGTTNLAASDDLATDLLPVASEYGLDTLKIACEYFMLPFVTESTVLSILQLAFKHNARHLQSQCIRCIVDHHTTILQSKQWQDLDKDIVFEVLKIACEELRHFMQK